MSEKKYLGSSRNIQGKFGEIQKISFSRKDLELMMDNLNEKGYINLNRIEKRETDKYGNTHYLVIDEWKPTEQPTERKTAADNIKTSQNTTAELYNDSLPF
jgi:FlaG/FlaF family flagellin (archaellin)